MQSKFKQKNKLYFQIYYLEIADDLTNLLVYHGYVNITYGFRRSSRRRNLKKNKYYNSRSSRKQISVMVTESIALSKFKN